MSDNTHWELKHPNLVEEFTRAYLDEGISLALIEKTLACPNSTAHSVARRLGLKPRERRIRKKPEAPVVSIQTLAKEEAELRQRLFDLEKRRLDLEVRVERQGNVVHIYGLSSSGLVATTVALVTAFLDGGGPVKLRQAVGKKDL